MTSRSTDNHSVEESPGKRVQLPRPDADNITVLTRELPNEPILPWHRFDSPWLRPDAETVAESLEELAAEGSDVEIHAVDQHLLKPAAAAPEAAASDTEIQTLEAEVSEDFTNLERSHLNDSHLNDQEQAVPESDPQNSDPQNSESQELEPLDSEDSSLDSQVLQDQDDEEQDDRQVVQGQVGVSEQAIDEQPWTADASEATVEGSESLSQDIEAGEANEADANELEKPQPNALDAVDHNDRDAWDDHHLDQGALERDALVDDASDDALDADDEELSQEDNESFEATSQEPSDLPESDAEEVGRVEEVPPFPDQRRVSIRLPKPDMGDRSSSVPFESSESELMPESVTFDTSDTTEAESSHLRMDAVVSITDEHYSLAAYVDPNDELNEEEL